MVGGNWVAVLTPSNSCRALAHCSVSPALSTLPETDSPELNPVSGTAPTTIQGQPLTVLCLWGLVGMG